MIFLFSSYLRCANDCCGTAKFEYETKTFTIIHRCENTRPQDEKLEDIQRFKDALKHTVQSGNGNLKAAYDITSLV